MISHAHRLSDRRVRTAGSRTAPVRRSGAPRAWRRRGRKAQVSAIATVLGLLLVVTFIANYISTTLPQTMSVNDVNHDLLVQNEVGRFAALLSQASTLDAVGAELSEPFVLGSVGAPPFAQQDSGAIGPMLTGSKETVGFQLTGGTGGSVYQVSSGSAFLVLLKNTYAPETEVAYDYGGVVFAQQGGIPDLVDPPPIVVSGSGASESATIWVPVFASQIPTEGGVGTAVLDVALTSVVTQTFPSGGVGIGSGGVRLTITTPFSAAWMAYFQANSEFAGDATCIPAGASVCSTSGTLALNGPFGIVTLTLPVTSVTLEVATFTISLH